MRYAIVNGSADTIRAYLPENYNVLVERSSNERPFTLIGGQDSRGWTLEDYVLPRLASGLYFGREVSTTGAVNFNLGVEPIAACT